MALRYCVIIQFLCAIDLMPVRYASGMKVTEERENYRGWCG